MTSINLGGRTLRPYPRYARYYLHLFFPDKPLLQAGKGLRVYGLGQQPLPCLFVVSNRYFLENECLVSRQKLCDRKPIDSFFPNVFCGLIRLLGLLPLPLSPADRRRTRDRHIAEDRGNTLHGYLFLHPLLNTTGRALPRPPNKRNAVRTSSATAFAVFSFIGAPAPRTNRIRPSEFSGSRHRIARIRIARSISYRVSPTCL
jgi:hypothetical protein